jgi:alpha-galactosidase
MRFSAENLPRGLTVNESNGQITGAVEKPGEFLVTLKAANALGTATRALKIVCGDRLALTPHMGWNSWYVWENHVTDGIIRDAADAMVTSGLINHGYMYVNIDDCWAVKPGAPDDSLAGQRRDPYGRVNPNRRFPDMKALTDYIHAHGLKAGIYTSPGPTTCAGHVGAYQHEEADVHRFVEWGFDFLKHDWCSYGSIAKDNGRDELQKPYRLISEILKRQPRDVVLNLCQYGMGNVWEWGSDVGGNCWRTTGDITDTWSSMSRIGFGQAGHEKFAGPGHWNDPDMLVVGFVGWSAKVRPTRLTPNEQYTHISLWSLLCSPLLIGCDMTKLDDFTLNLLTNDEVLDVSQDELGRQAARISKQGSSEVWAKDLADGSKAVGLFNLGEETTDVTVTWSDLGIVGKHQVRDLWRQLNLGKSADSFQASVPRHGVVLVKISGR